MAAHDPDGVDDDAPKPGLIERLKDAMLKPAVAAELGPEEKDEGPTTIPEIEAAIDRADDKERLIGLLLAPVAAAVTFIVTASLINNDAKTRLADGTIQYAHNPHSYLEVGGISMILALLMLTMAWWRKRLFLGITMALFGLSFFNLHFWGFGIPYIIAGSWYLVRAYRLQEKLKLAQRQGGGGGGTGRRSQVPNKRYTPPTTRPAKPKPDEEQRAG